MTPWSPSATPKHSEAPIKQAISLRISKFQQVFTQTTQ